jgi:hypothetical protein
MKLLGLTLALSGCAYNPTVLGTTIERKALCPSAGKYCAQNIGNITAVSITKELRYLTALPDGRPNVWTFLGREYTVDASPIVNFCGNESKNPFQTFAAGRLSNEELIVDTVATNTVNFTRKASSRRSFESSVDVDALLNAAGIPTGTSRIEAEAALRAALARLDNSDIQMRGRFSFVYLEPSILALLKANTVPDELQACSTALRSGAKPIIASMTLVKIDTMTSSGTLKNDASGSIDAALTGKLDGSKLASLKAEFENSIEQTYSTAFSPTWQVLSIGGYNGQ